MDTFMQDIRFAFRTLGKNPGFTVIAVLILALGIGATTAVFSVVNAVLLRPLPYRDPERLVAITSVFEPNKSNRRVSVIPLAEMEEWRKQSRTLDSMGAFAYTELPIQVGTQAFFPVTALMDPEFMPTIGNDLAMGTLFTKRSEIEGADKTVIITHRFWQEAFNADPVVIGREIVVDGNTYTVRGILQSDFQFPRSDASYFTKDIEMLLPSSNVPGFPATARQWFGIARLKAGVSITAAQSELQTIVAAIAETAPEKKDWSVRLTPLGEETARSSKAALLITLGISIVLLLIASTNLMNLLFSRGASRLREMAIRKAIGSTTGRLVRQLLTESACLALFGAVGGIPIASLGINVLVALSPVHLPVAHQIRIDGVVLTFTFLTCAVAALGAGVFPALHLSAKCEEAVRNPGARATASRTLATVQRGLCITQIALGVALLAAAGLLAHSLWRLNAVDPGFRSEGVFGFSLSVPNDRTMDQRKRFYAQALEEIRTIPGVLSDGWITFLPPETRAGVFMGLSFESGAKGGAPPVANHMISSADYFSTMQMRVVRGRDFAQTDTGQSPPVIIVNEALARKYFPNEDGVGRRIGTAFDGGKPVREIIGVVNDSHDRGLQANAIPTVYIPFQQFALPYGSIAVRSRVTWTDLIPEIRQRLNRLDSGVPLTDFQLVNDRIHQSLEEPRFYTMMATACAVMAVLFVSLGLYGLISFSVSRRTAEFGVRMAIGARDDMILRMVLLQGLRMALIGALVGVALSLAFTRVLTSLLFQVKPIDPLTLAVAVAIVVLVTVLATYVPARRASRVSPIAALRYE